MDKLRLIRADNGKGLRNRIKCNKIKNLDQGEVMMFIDLIQVRKNGTILLCSYLTKTSENLLGASFRGFFRNKPKKRINAFPIEIHVVKKPSKNITSICDYLIVFKAINVNPCEVIFEVFDD